MTDPMQSLGHSERQKHAGGDHELARRLAAAGIRELGIHACAVSPITIWLFVQLRTEAGRVGTGEATLPGQETAVVAQLRRLAAPLAGVPAAVDEIRPAGQNPAAGALAAATAAGAIDQALWNLQGQAAGRPLAGMLGTARRDDVAVYANINRRTRDRSPDGFVASAKAALAQGFDAIKVAPFDEVRNRSAAAADQLRSAGEGLARIAAVRAALAPDMRLMVDCHWRFSPAAAAALIPELAALGVWWLECPVPEIEDDIDAVRGLRRLANDRRMVLAGCETMIGVGGFRPWIEAQAYDVVMPDVKHVGGLGDLLLIDEPAGAHGIELAPHNPSGPVAHAVSVHMSTLLEGFLILEQQFDESPRFAGIVDGALPTADGRAVPPRGHGLGVRLKPSDVQAWQDRGA